MKLLENVFWVGSGQFGLSHERDCHVYLVRDGKEAALIDSGCGLDTDIIIKNILETGCGLDEIKYLFLTHSHADHAGGIAKMRECMNFKVVASQEEKALLEEGSDWDLGLTLAKSVGSYPQDYVYRHAKVDIVAEDHKSFSVGKLEMVSYVTPGHSAGSTCYLLKDKERNSLFSGDSVFFKGLLFVINSPGSAIGSYRDSLHKLSGLDVSALFPGHDIWTLARGQKHVDIAIESLKSVFLPPMKR